MTDPQHSLIAVLLDRSGSMESIKSDTEGGFNAFITDQRKEPLDIRVTLAQFDTDYEVVYANRPDYSWDFVFLGANMDAVAIGERLGFAPEKSMTYAADGDGVGTAWAATTSYVARRNAAPVGAAVAGFSDEERAAAQGNR